MLREQAGLRRRESQNPERHRAGKREEVENIYFEVLMYSIDETKEGSRDVGAFPTPTRGDPNHGISDHSIYFFLSPKVLPSHTPK